MGWVGKVKAPIVSVFIYCICIFLCLFSDITKNMMSKTKDLTTFLNPGQTPVMEVDEPLYVFTKKIQWTWVDEYGEAKFVLMPGGLHI